MGFLKQLLFLFCTLSLSLFLPVSEIKIDCLFVLAFNNLAISSSPYPGGFSTCTGQDKTAYTAVRNKPPHLSD